MVETLREVLAVLVVAALAVVAASMLTFFAVAVWTVFTGSRRDLLAKELDEVLAEILGNTPTTEIKASRHRRFENG